MASAGFSQGVAMASFRKKGGRNWYFRFVDAEGVMRERKGCPDRRATEQLAAAAEAEAAKIRSGFIDARDIAYQRHATTPLADHIDAFEAFLLSKGDTAKHAKLYSDRAR